MSRVYVGGLDTRITERDLEEEFVRFGTLRSVWVARKPPGFAFIEYEDLRDAEDAIRKLDGHQGWRVELSRRGERRPPPGGGGGGYGGGGGDRYGDGPPRGGGGGRGEMRCYECGELGHLARDCRARGGDAGTGGGGRGGGGGGGGGDRYGGDRGRSPPPRRRSPSYEPRDRRSPSYDGAARSRSRSRA